MFRSVAALVNETSKVLVCNSGYSSALFVKGTFGPVVNTVAVRQQQTMPVV